MSEKWVLRWLRERASTGLQIRQKHPQPLIFFFALRHMQSSLFYTWNVKGAWRWASGPGIGRPHSWADIIEVHHGAMWFTQRVHVTSNRWVLAGSLLLAWEQIRTCVSSSGKWLWWRTTQISTHSEGPQAKISFSGANIHTPNYFNMVTTK